MRRTECKLHIITNYDDDDDEDEFSILFLFIINYKATHLC